MFIVPKILYIKRSCVHIIGNYHQIDGNQKKITAQIFERKVQITRHTQKEARLDKLEED